MTAIERNINNDLFPEQLEAFNNREIKVTMLSNGAGQETTYLIHRIATDSEFRNRHVKGRLVVVGSDTGDEHDHTYENVHEVKKLCDTFGIEFHWLTPDMGFHSKTWHALTAQYHKNSNIGSAAFPQTCTDNLKVKNVDRFLDWWIGKEYGYNFSNKRNILSFYKDYSKIRLILGFAKGEDSRTIKGGEFDAAWKKTAVERYYPLILDGIDRQACIDYNEAHIPHKVWPSNCMRCFYQSDQEIVWLHRFHPDKFQEWVEMEAAKIAKNAHKEINLGVYGKLLLPQKLEKALKLYGHWTDEQLNEYKFSHGHCIKSKY